jgi:hypothetical protein
MVLGLHTRLTDKIALHTMACDDVDALLALIDPATRQNQLQDRCRPN